MSNRFIPFSPDRKLQITRRRLPHWEQPGATYFVTFRTYDSLPLSRIRELIAIRDQWLRVNPRPWPFDEYIIFQQQTFLRLDRWLDKGTGSNPLSNPEAALIVASSLTHFDGRRYHLDRFVIMPNHVHAILKILEGWKLATVVRSWKNYTGNRLNRLIERSGRFWMGESFDHIVRTEFDLRRYRAYIEDNPVCAKLGEGQYLLGSGSGIEI